MRGMEAGVEQARGVRGIRGAADEDVVESRRAAGRRIRGPTMSIVGGGSLREGLRIIATLYNFQELIEANGA